MGNESRLMTLFEEANPVPDEQTVEETATEPATYLANLRQGSSQVFEVGGRPSIESGSSAKGTRWLAVAAFLAVIGLASLITAQTTGDSFRADGPEATIERFLTTTNYDSLVELVTADWLAARAPALMTEIDGEQLARMWSDYWTAEEIMGVERNLDFDTCDGTPDTILRCTVTYTSDITRAMGEPYVERSTFKLVDNKIAIGDLPAPTTFVLEFASYARYVGIREFDDLCVERHPDDLLLPNHRRPGPACVNLIMQNLEGWARWVSNSGGR
jgi:hypothetical protein